VAPRPDSGNRWYRQPLSKNRSIHSGVFLHESARANRKQPKQDRPRFTSIGIGEVLRLDGLSQILLGTDPNNNLPGAGYVDRKSGPGLQTSIHIRNYMRAVSAQRNSLERTLDVIAD
jgi:hypothetical protein